MWLKYHLFEQNIDKRSTNYQKKVIQDYSFSIGLSKIFFSVDHFSHWSKFLIDACSLVNQTFFIVKYNNFLTFCNAFQPQWLSWFLTKINFMWKFKKNFKFSKNVFPSLSFRPVKYLIVKKVPFAFIFLLHTVIYLRAMHCQSIGWFMNQFVQ